MNSKSLTAASQPSDTTREAHQVAATVCSIRKLSGLLLLVLTAILGIFSAEALAQTSTTYAVPGTSATCTAPGKEPCLYVSDLNFTIDHMDFDMPVPSRSGYSIPLRVRFPVTAPGVRPVVIWHHGGNPSPDGRMRSQRWGETLAAAGYVVIHPSRVRNPATFKFMRKQCAENGFDELGECAFWIATSRVGPMNTHFIIDNLSMIENAIGVTLNADKIVVAGHSAGSIAVLLNAGAWQRWVPGGKVYRERDNRPIAFLATGLVGPTYANWSMTGFPEGKSFRNIDRPFAFITGVRDKTRGRPPEAQVASWLTVKPDNKYLSYDNKKGALHETMNLNKCDTLLRRKHCRWIASFGLAYLDAIVRERPEAIAWLESDAYDKLTKGAIELHRR